MAKNDVFIELALNIAGPQARQMEHWKDRYGSRLQLVFRELMGSTAVSWQSPQDLLGSVVIVGSFQLGREGTNGMKSQCAFLWSTLRVAHVQADRAGNCS